MTALDIVVLLLMGLGGAFGFSRGFVSESISLAAWILGILAVKALHDPVSAMLAAPVGTESGASVLAFALIFGVIFFAVRMIGRAVGKTTKRSLLGPFDRMLGMGFGALKGLIAATLVFLLFTLTYDTIYTGSAPRPAWISESRTYPLLRASSAAVVDFVERRRAQ